ncbi:MAG: glutamine amidotransferase of anthranilate synthase, anthranilate synthase component II [Candidatus Peregrinibacteria bacterium GW2011_GWF2_43_17]|nr:MAG: glutamine amidotransferase of anthranilate synthase, anthranilate synthase component II [Candidatus Peregrinibacteria bacterium GW2011_GWF2_43_17]KKT19586.1 MAG: Anthranilate synthase component II [Candidatus Peregrinibacteria bacterium GW2011_GWA2_43_8]HAU39971.1 aminodeoxychorismate/anthranilate synthase component II [Candidatus Peregrinibacteria bacterium]
MKIILIDNYDSFTFNLYQQIMRLGGDVDVKKYDEISVRDIDTYDAIVISPGPKKPSDYPICLEVIAKFYEKKPVLGVCLGHQSICEVFGAKTVRADKVMHGKTSTVHHSGERIFRGIKNPFRAARYHSLVTDRVPDEFDLTAWSFAPQNKLILRGDKIIMGVAHEKYPVYGVQFHPESFLTERADKIIRNFLNEIR